MRRGWWRKKDACAPKERRWLPLHLLAPYERQLDRFPEDAQQAAFLLFFGSDRFHGMAANRAELQHLAAAAAQAGDALVAKHLVAVRATMRHFRFRVPPAEHGAVGQHDGRRFDGQ